MPLPADFDEIDLAELLDVVADLIGWLRVDTFDEPDGERESLERARRLLLRYGKAT